MWIHGGGWREFSGTAPGFNGTTLVRAQDVVVVTINHRLNGFGFLRLEGSDPRFADSGNAGLLDIVAALRLRPYIRLCVHMLEPANLTGRP